MTLLAGSGQRVNGVVRLHPLLRPAVGVVIKLDDIFFHRFIFLTNSKQFETKLYINDFTNI